MIGGWRHPQPSVPRPRAVWLAAESTRCATVLVEPALEPMYAVSPVDAIPPGIGVSARRSCRDDHHGRPRVTGVRVGVAAVLVDLGRGPRRATLITHPVLVESSGLRAV